MGAWIMIEEITKLPRKVSFDDPQTPRSQSAQLLLRSAMPKRFRLVLVGAGQIGAQSHFPATLSCDGVELTAIVDVSPERAERLVRQYGLSVPVFAELKSALSNADGAIVATPNQTHYDVSSQCLEMGVPVLIEKPMTVTLDEASRLQNLANERGIVVMVGYVTRYRRNVRLLRSLLEERHFGRIERFAYQYGTVGGWSPLSGYGSKSGGVLAVTGSHFLDRMLWYWGYPDQMSFQSDGDRGPEANCIAKFRFANGMRGILRCSKTVALPGALVIETEAGHLTMLDNDDAEIRLRPRISPHIEYVIKGSFASESANDADVFVAQIIDFVNTCRTGIGFGCDVQQGAASIRLIEDLYSLREAIPMNWYGQAPWEKA
jgi:predicted dehydrogenase